MRYHLFLLPFLCSLASPAPLLPLPTRFLKPKHLGTTEYSQLAHPLSTDHQTPSCSLLLLNATFANTYGSPPISASFSPPSDFSWTSAVLEFRASVAGEQYDRIAAVWIDGVELLRTSTAEPTEGGVHWTVRKDVTQYASVLRRRNSTVSVMLENIVNEEFTGVYNVNVSAYFYGGNDENEVKLGFDGRNRISSEKNFEGERKSGVLWKEGIFRSMRKLGLMPKRTGDGERKLGFLSDEILDDVTKLRGLLRENAEKSKKLGFLADTIGEKKLDCRLIETRFGGLSELGFRFQEPEKTGTSCDFLSKEPADLIIPISSNGDDGFWFRIQGSSDVHLKKIEIPPNTYRAVLEIYVSFHSNDEFWYSNPPNAYIKLNNLTTERGNGSFREVVAMIDGIYVGSVVPFPVVFTGGINPLFWEPFVGIGAFSLPSYNLDLTPFLGLLLDGKPHSLGLGVTDGIQFWLVDANLHLWLDHDSSQIQAKLVQYSAPELSASHHAKFNGLDGSFKISAKRKTEFSGWVNSSVGNLTTHVIHEHKFKSTIKFKGNGSIKEVKQKIKAKTEMRIEAYSVLLLARAVHKTKYPLHIITSTIPNENNTSLLTTNFSNGVEDESSLVLPSGVNFRSLSDSQEADGWMLVEDHSVLSGLATTRQNYRYNDEKGCYYRNVVATDGKISSDNSTDACIVSL